MCTMMDQSVKKGQTGAMEWDLNVIYDEPREFFSLWEGSLKVEEDGGKNVFEGKGSGKVEFDPCQQLTDSGPYFEEAVLQGVKLSVGPLCTLEPFVCQGVQKHIGGTVQKEAELVGLEPVTGGTV